MNELTTNDKKYDKLLSAISEQLLSGRSQAVREINNILVETYWNIGRYIVEFEQQGQEKAEYGSELLAKLSRDLKGKHGKGFSRRNILDMRRFYLAYPKWQTVSAKLGWSHYVELLNISNELARSFYEKQTIKDGWSVRELQRQRSSGLFERLALSKDKDGLLELSRDGQTISTPRDIIKDPYVFEFLDIPEKKVKERELENRLVERLEHFLLELGKGFAFIGQQYRITLNNNHFYIDLVFYHRILKCFVLIDLKIDKVNHQDIGQMNMYLNYFKAEENVQGDNDPIGIVLAADKDEVMVEYATGSISNHLFVSKYQLELPQPEELKRFIERQTVELQREDLKE